MGTPPKWEPTWDVGNPINNGINYLSLNWWVYRISGSHQLVKFSGGISGKSSSAMWIDWLIEDFLSGGLRLDHRLSISWWVGVRFFSPSTSSHPIVILLGCGQISQDASQHPDYYYYYIYTYFFNTRFIINITIIIIIIIIYIYTYIHIFRFGDPNLNLHLPGG